MAIIEKIINVFLSLIMLFSSSFNQSNKMIDEIMGFQVSDKIRLKDRKNIYTFFQDDRIRIYKITDMSLLKDIPDDFELYTKKLPYCSIEDPIHKYLISNRIVYKVKNVCPGSFATVFIDYENKILIYHRVDYLIT